VDSSEQNIDNEDNKEPIRSAIHYANGDILRLQFSSNEDNFAERDFNVFGKDFTLSVPQADHLTKILSTINEDYRVDFNPKLDELNQRSWELKRKINRTESFYGLGDKPLTLDLRGRKLMNWGTDTYAFPYAADPLYKNIPFFISVTDSACHGIFVNNTFKLNFDFGSSDDNLTISAPGGMIDLFIIPGSSPIEVITKYTLLTGTPELPPLWALGYHQSKWSYVPEAVISHIAVEFRKLMIPCDCLYLDIDYMDGYRVFTWDKEKFPNPPHLVNSLESSGFKIVAIIDPGIKIDADYLIYVEGMENDYFVKDAEGENYIGPVWPGYCHFPDFTRDEVRKWWAEHVRKLFDSGIDGVWNDMNEPALFNKDDMIQTQRTFDDNVVMDFEGHPGLFSEGHNIYGMRMSEATFDGAKAVKNKRPFVLTRSTYAGGQKFASVWTGDNAASWEHLKIANYQCQMLSISGFSFTGSDVGGFVGEPDGELYVRWLQLALFHPFYRTHSSKDFGDQEPWSYGEEWTNAARSVIEWRYRLLGYIYSTFKSYSESGIPMIRPLSIIHYDETSKKRQFDEFYFGDALLVTPVMEPKQSGSWVDLPKGDFYHLGSGQYFEGGNLVFIKNDFQVAPALLVGGHVLPIWPVMQYTGQKPITEVELWCGFTEISQVKSMMYLDEFDGYEYKEGQYAQVDFEYLYADNIIEIHCTSEGSYVSKIQKYVFKLFLNKSVPKSVNIDSIETKFSIESNLLIFEFDKVPELIRIDF